MGKRVSIKHKRREAPEWVFPWRPLRGASISKWPAILLVGGVFAFFLSSVRIRVSPPVSWAARKATVIHVSDDAEGRALTLRAIEGGPFPSRFEPSAWEGAVALEQAAFEAARWTPPPYVPVLRELPERTTPPLRISAMAGPVLPTRRSASRSSPGSDQTQAWPGALPALRDHKSRDATRAAALRGSGGCGDDRRTMAVSGETGCRRPRPGVRLAGRRSRGRAAAVGGLAARRELPTRTENTRALDRGGRRFHQSTRRIPTRRWT